MLRFLLANKGANCKSHTDAIKRVPPLPKTGRFSHILEGHVLSWPSFPGLLQLTQGHGLTVNGSWLRNSLEKSATVEQ